MGIINLINDLLWTYILVALLLGCAVWFTPVSYTHLIMLDFLQNVKRGRAHKLSREGRVLKEDGSFMWTHVNIIVERYMPEQNIIEIICINYDITQLKQTEACLLYTSRCV